MHWVIINFHPYIRMIFFDEIIMHIYYINSRVNLTKKNFWLALSKIIQTFFSLICEDRRERGVHD